jgi:hypothetical protein
MEMNGMYMTKIITKKAKGRSMKRNRGEGVDG